MLTRYFTQLGAPSSPSCGCSLVLGSEGKGGRWLPPPRFFSFCPGLEPAVRAGGRAGGRQRGERPDVPVCLWFVQGGRALVLSLRVVSMFFKSVSRSAEESRQHRGRERSPLSFLSLTCAFKDRDGIL